MRMKMKHWACLALILGASLDLAAADTTPALTQPAAPGVELLFAAKKGDLAKARKALADGADVNIAGKDGLRPLHIAAINGHMEIMVLLLDHGAKVDARDEGGMTPLHAAAFEGRREVAALLLKRGADPNPVDAQGYTPLQYARANGKSDVAAILQTNSAEAPRNAAARVFTDENVAVPDPEGPRGFNTYSTPAAQDDPPASQLRSTAGTPHSPSGACAERLRALQKRRQEILSKSSNFDWVDKDKVQAEIRDEEQNYNPSSGRWDYQDSLEAAKARTDHEEKMRKLRKLENSEKSFSPEAEKELREIDIQISNTQIECSQLPVVR
jgi:hypothetical protein